MKKKIYDDLVQLRKELKTLHYNETGEKVLICTDYALKQMATKLPENKNEFNSISGLEKNFIEQYANQFLSIILTHKNGTNKQIRVSREALKVLNHYKDRLTNLSKSNPNLFISKIRKNKTFDLFNIDDDKLVEFLTNNRHKVFRFPKNEKINNHLTTLYREANKEYLESGAYNLYIAYPYVEGYYLKEKFPIKAPLLFFPVILERNKREFLIRKNNDKDIILNRDLLLVSSKFENSNNDFTMPIIEDFSFNTLKSIVVPFYEKHDFNIKFSDDENRFISFNNELKEDFIKRKPTDFKFKNYVTLGRFSPYSSMIQKDMDKILDKRKYNDLLEGLIENDKSELVDEKINLKHNIINEREISYINELNDSQEQVIEVLNKEKKLVVWGPPGTGKSQTITSLIAQSVLKGENVLVVSEKNVALDVIYKRLNSANKYALFIDDPFNKTKFYKEISSFIDPTPPIRTNNNEIFEIEEEILEITDNLNAAIKQLYKDNNKYLDIYDRYLSDRKVIEELTPKRVYQIFKNNIKNYTFDDILDFEKKFRTNKILETYLCYHTISNQYKIFHAINQKISRSDIIEYKKFDEKYEAYKVLSKHSNKVNKFFMKKRFIRENISLLESLFIKKRHQKKYIKILFDDEKLHRYLMSNITRLNNLENKYNNLSKKEIKFLTMFQNNFRIEMRKYIFDAFFTGAIESFEAKNQNNLDALKTYQEQKIKLNKLIEKKRLVTTESFEMDLYRYALNFSNTKRIMDIKRIFDSTKKPSIKSFVENFRPEIMENVKIFMMTPEVVSAIMPLEQGIFDLVIFDEASQMYVEKGIPAIYRAKKVVIAGDPKQLRPSSLGFSKLQEESLVDEDDILPDISLDARSLLDLARYKYHETILNYHYRSKYEELIAFSNHAFYGGKLIISPNNKNSSKPPIEYIHVPNGIFVDRRNILEAKAVVELVKKIFRQRKSNESIGIITFNSNQRDTIMNYIDKELFKTGVYQKKFEQELVRKDSDSDASLFVKNIENVQGDERDIIIFSMGYANDETGNLMRRFGWLNHDGGENRLNVAITRAKKKIYFVSSLYPEEFRVDDLQSNGPKLLKDFMRYCYAVSNKDFAMAKVVLENLNKTENTTRNIIKSLVVEEVESRLKQNKFKVARTIGIGEYSVDLAVFDEKDKEYKIGIICDVKNITNVNSRKQLIHEEKYLEARGWKIYRIFSSNWFVDKNSEMKKIRDIIRNN